MTPCFHTAITSSAVESPCARFLCAASDWHGGTATTIVIRHYHITRHTVLVAGSLFSTIAATPSCFTSFTFTHAILVYILNSHALVH